MNAPISTSEPAGPFDLAGLAAPGRLARAARLYAIVLDGDGQSGPRAVPRQPAGGRRRLRPGGARRPLRAARAGRSSTTAPADRPCRSTPPPSTPGTRRCSPHRDCRTAMPRPSRWRRATAAPCRTGLRHRAQNLWLEADAPILRYPRPAAAPGLAGHDAPGAGQPDPAPRSRPTTRCARDRQRRPCSARTRRRRWASRRTDRAAHRRRA